jgi:hypothetical protein
MFSHTNERNSEQDAIKRILDDLVVTMKIFFIPVETDDNSMRYQIVMKKSKNKTKNKEDVNWAKEGF